MAGMTISGLDELRTAVSALPDRVRTASRAVAHKSAVSIRNDAARRLRAQQKTDAHAMADLIEVAEYPDEQRFTVTMRAPANQSANTAIWNEYGTVKMAARPSMGPAATAEAPRYVGELEQVIGATIAGTLG